MQTPKDGEEFSHATHGTPKAQEYSFASPPDPSMAPCPLSLQPRSQSPSTSQQGMQIGACYSPKSSHSCERVKSQPPLPLVDLLIMLSKERNNVSSNTPKPGVKNGMDAKSSVPNTLHPSDGDNAMMAPHFEFQGLREAVLMAAVDQSLRQGCSDDDSSVSTLTSIDSQSVADSLHAGYLNKSLRLRSPVASVVAVAVVDDCDADERLPCPDISRAA
jgi:hypothetical protein